jgi:hypothetical protein
VQPKKRSQLFQLRRLAIFVKIRRGQMAASSTGRRNTIQCVDFDSRFVIPALI